EDDELPVNPDLGGVVHSDEIKIPTAEGFHGKILARSNYDFTNCQSCHGVEFDGGFTELSCNSSGCHVAADGGPKACYTCHGDFGARVAYPTTAPSHKVHLTLENGDGAVVDCATCHPSADGGYDDPNHLGGSNPDGVEVMLGGLAARQTNGTVGSPAFDATAMSCANTYCHGNFTNGNNATVTWNGTDQAACGTCHGDPATGNPLPPSPHPPVESCVGCHGQTVDANQNIIDKTLHINGELNVFGSVREDW
ncbi:MAG: hypothetical protein CL946_11025, partial [Ectothiorhodospiraceae bacterium]|nr:hypothetical protein [Ectothiorhodospiraceae bacterium]